jgi:hypothetical protein
MATIAMSAFRTPAVRGRAAIGIGGFQQLRGLLPLQSIWFSGKNLVNEFYGMGGTLFLPTNVLLSCKTKDRRKNGSASLD